MPSPSNRTEVATQPRIWSDTLQLDALQVVAEGVTDFAGFEIASILVVRGEEVECVAVAGDEEVAAKVLGTRAPVGVLLDLLPVAEDWGLLKFVPHERLNSEPEKYGFLPEHWDDNTPHHDAWHSRDGLFVPLYDQQGRLRGALSVDRPRDGRRPGPPQREILERYSVHALSAILSILEHEDLSQRMRMTETARRVVRTATTQTSLSAIVDDCRAALLAGYSAREAWVHVFDDALLEEPSANLVGSQGGPTEVVATTRRLASAAWREQQVLRLTGSGPIGPTLSESDQAVAQEFLAERRIGSLMLVPLGASEECLGALMLTRGRADPEWNDLEAATVLDLGHDLGRSLLNLRTLDQHERLVERLRAVDAYKDQLISTISHELRTPLTSILGNLELLELDDLTTDESEAALSAADRGARRLVRTVEDLLLLSRISDPDAIGPHQKVDIRDVARGVRDLTAMQAQLSDQRVELILPEQPGLAFGDSQQLDRAVANLVTNALKYSPAGSTVTLTVHSEQGQVCISCSDEGIGISEADQESVFREFFRSSDPEARGRGGTGLGLAIVDRIMRRHNGRVEVVSTLGHGSTFRLWLPGA